MQFQSRRFLDQDGRWFLGEAVTEDGELVRLTAYHSLDRGHLALGWPGALLLPALTGFISVIVDTLKTTHIPELRLQGYGVRTEEKSLELTLDTINNVPLAVQELIHRVSAPDAAVALRLEVHSDAYQSDITASGSPLFVYWVQLVSQDDALTLPYGSCNMEFNSPPILEILSMPTIDFVVETSIVELDREPIVTFFKDAFVAINSSPQ